MMSCRTAITYHDTYGRRGFTALRKTWNRYQVFLSLWPESLAARSIPIVEAPAARENEILHVHSPAYVDLVQHLSLTGEGKLDGSTPAWQGMYARAERIVGGSLLGADMIASGQAIHVFNPAGGQHHSHHDRGGGFCVFNDVVAAVRRFQDRGYKRVAVIDVDGHHGDGTESLLYDEPTLTVSMHQFGDRTYPGTGDVDDTGREGGHGYAMNLPLASGTGDGAYLDILRLSVDPLVRRYRPDVLIVQFGTDAHAADPLLRLRLSTGAYARIASWMHTLAHELCDGRLLVVGGGGYDPQHVVRCWMIMLAELAGFHAEQAHRDAPNWIAEAVVTSDVGADTVSRAAARRARQAVFPLHGLPV